MTHLFLLFANCADPYVVVSIGHRRVHKTKAIKNTRDPIYTVKERSVFVLDVATKEIKDHDGITFQVMDFDLVGKHDALGQVTVPADKILEASGDRLELQLRNKGVDAGFLAIRCRPAKEYEREFLATLSGSTNISDFMGVKMSHVKAMNPFQVMRVAKGMVTRRTRMDHGVKMVNEEAVSLKLRVFLPFLFCHIFLFPQIHQVPCPSIPGSRAKGHY